eukprot:5580605-Amphidinium_carterae.1
MAAVTELAFPNEAGIGIIVFCVVPIYNSKSLLLDRGLNYATPKASKACAHVVGFLPAPNNGTASRKRNGSTVHTTGRPS